MVTVDDGLAQGDVSQAVPARGDRLAARDDPVVERLEFALYAPDRRLRLSFPSPFLRNEPATLEIEDGAPGTARAWRTEEVVSYESGFRRELEAFHDWITTGREPVTAGRDGLRDVALCQAIIDSHHRGTPVDDPTERTDQ